MTNLLQPLDVNTNSTIKKAGKREFSDYIATTTTNEILRNPNHDVTITIVDLRLDLH